MVDMKHLNIHYYTYDTSMQMMLYSHSTRLQNQFDLSLTKEVHPVSIPSIDSFFFFQEFHDLGEFIKMVHGDDAPII